MPWLPTSPALCTQRNTGPGSLKEMPSLFPSVLTVRNSRERWGEIIAVNGRDGLLDIKEVMPSLPGSLWPASTSSISVPFVELPFLRFLSTQTIGRSACLCPRTSSGASPPPRRFRIPGVSDQAFTEPFSADCILFFSSHATGTRLRVRSMRTAAVPPSGTHFAPFPARSPTAARVPWPATRTSAPRRTLSCSSR